MQYLPILTHFLCLPLPWTVNWNSQKETVYVKYSSMISVAITCMVWKKLRETGTYWQLHSLLLPCHVAAVMMERQNSLAHLAWQLALISCGLPLHQVGEAQEFHSPCLRPSLPQFCHWPQIHFLKIMQIILNACLDKIIFIARMSFYNI